MILRRECEYARNVSHSLLTSHFILLSVNPAAWIFARAAQSQLSCSCWVGAKMSTLSTWHKMSSWPSRIWLILLWNCSGALEIPIANGSLLKQYLPYGVRKVVRCREFLARGVCQNPQLASSLLKTLAPVTLDRGVLLTEHVCSCRGLKSTHVQTDPDLFIWYHYHSGTPWSRLFYLWYNSKELHPAWWVCLELSCTGEGDVMRSEQCTGLGIWLQLDLKSSPGHG